MDAKQIVEAFRQLPTDDRVRFIEQLWNGVAQEPDRHLLGEAQQRLLDERIQEHETFPGDVEVWATARDDILREL